jgi:uncharacterized membrane protein
MAILIVGLILFLGPHSLKMAAPRWRRAVVNQRGEGPVKGLVALSSLIGIVLIVWGFASAGFVSVYAPPPWGPTLCAILMIPALVLAIASGAPPGYIKRAVVNPLLVATMLWAVGHLLALGDLASLILFGAFLLWSIVDWAMQPTGVSVRAPVGRSDIIAIVAGLVLYALLVWRLHGWLFGVAPTLL